MVTQDIALWVKDLSDPNFQLAVKDVGGIYVSPFEHHGPALAGASLELFDIVTHMTGKGTFEDEKIYKVVIELEKVKVPVLALERIIVSKRAANREKDKLVLPVLEDALFTFTDANDNRVEF